MSTSKIWAGETGKISGTINDKTTGEPLIGASVVVVGTSLGAASDIDGHYTILYVPPGNYDLQVSFIGYRKTTIEDVRVHIDQTARVDVDMEAHAVDLSEMVIVAETKAIKRDVATSVVAVSSKEIIELPVQFASYQYNVINFRRSYKHGTFYYKSSFAVNVSTLHGVSALVRNNR